MATDGASFLSATLGGLSLDVNLWLVVGQPVALAFAVFFAARSAGGFSRDSPARPPWVLLATALAMLAVAESLEAFRASTHRPSPPFPSVSDVLFLLWYVPLVAALVRFLRVYRSSGLGDEFQTSPLVWSLGAFFVASSLVAVRPTLQASVSLDSIHAASLPVLDALTLLPTMRLIQWTRRLRGGRLFGVWLAVLLGLGANCGADLAFAYLNNRAALVSPGGLDPYLFADILYLAAYAAIAWGLFLHARLVAGSPSAA